MKMSGSGNPAAKPIYIRRNIFPNSDHLRQTSISQDDPSSSI